MKIDRQELLDALEIVKPGLANKEIIEQSTSFAFMEGRIVTFNDEISISHPVSGLNITGAVKAEEFYGILNKLKKEEITIVLKENELILKSGSSKAGLVLQAEISLPLDEIEEINKWGRLPANFVEALKFTVHATSRDMSRPILTCVHINKDGFVEASDSNRVALFELIKEMPVDTFLIPSHTVLEIIKMAPTKVAKSPNWIHFKTKKGTIISCRIFVDSFPDTKEILKVQGVQIEFPKIVQEVLDRASVFAKREQSLDENVTISLEDHFMNIESKSDFGWFKERIKIEFDLIPISFNITPNLLMDILNKTHTCIISDTMIKFEASLWQYVIALRHE